MPRKHTEKYTIYGGTKGNYSNKYAKHENACLRRTIQVSVCFLIIMLLLFLFNNIRPDPYCETTNHHKKFASLDGRGRYDQSFYCPWEINLHVGSENAHAPKTDESKHHNCHPRNSIIANDYGAVNDAQPRYLQFCNPTIYGTYHKVHHNPIVHPLDSCGNLDGSVWGISDCTITYNHSITSDNISDNLKWDTISINSQNNDNDTDDDDDDDDDVIEYDNIINCPSANVKPSDISRLLANHVPKHARNSANLNVLFVYFSQFILSDITRIKTSNDRYFSADEYPKNNNHFNITSSFYQCIDKVLSHSSTSTSSDEESENIPPTDKDYTENGDIEKLLKCYSRNPVNTQTAWIDASQIYGTNFKSTARLRSFERGMLKVSYPKEGDCSEFSSESYPTTPSKNYESTPDSVTGSSYHFHPSSNVHNLHTVKTTTSSSSSSSSTDEAFELLSDEHKDLSTEIEDRPLKDEIARIIRKNHHETNEESHRKRLCSLPPVRIKMSCNDDDDNDNHHSNDDDHGIHNDEQIMFLCGDHNECNNNIGLLAWHILFLREHNYWAQYFHKSHPNWDDDILFNMARLLVISEIQHITFKYWLPSLLGNSVNFYPPKSEHPIVSENNYHGNGHISGNNNNNDNKNEDGNTKKQNHMFGKKPVRGLCYDDEFDPRVIAEFPSILRLHSMIPGQIYYRHEKSPYSVYKERSLDTNLEGKITNIKDLIEGHSTLGSILLGLINNPAEEQDILFDSSLTNTTFYVNQQEEQINTVICDKIHRNLQSSYGSDIAIDLIRDRELGFPTFSSLYWKVHGSKLAGWTSITDDQDTIEILKDIYGEHGWNLVDLWIGVISEKHYLDSTLGKTSFKIVEDQFYRLMKSDYFFYTRDLLKQPLLSRTFATSTEHIAERNTFIEEFSKHTFRARVSNIFYI